MGQSESHVVSMENPLASEEDLPTAQILTYPSNGGMSSNMPIEPVATISVESLVVPLLSTHPIVDFDFKKKIYEYDYFIFYSISFYLWNGMIILFSCHIEVSGLWYTRPNRERKIISALPSKKSIYDE